MRLRPVTHSQKCCVLIDGNYIDRLSKSVRFDFLEFVDFLRAKFQITDFVNFCRVPVQKDVFPNRRLLDWLSYNGFVVKQKSCGNYSPVRTRDTWKSVALEMTVHAFEACHHTDGVFFITYGSNVCAAIALQRNSNWVTLIGAERGASVALPNELRRTADDCLAVSSFFGNPSPVPASAGADKTLANSPP